MSRFFADCPNPNCEHLYQRIGDPCNGCGETIPGQVIALPSRTNKRMTPEDVAEIKACLEPCERCGQPLVSSKIEERFPWLTGSTLSRIRSGKYDHWLET